MQPFDAFDCFTDDRVVACIDIGGTKITAGLASRRGFAGQVREPTVKTGDADALAGQVLRLTQQACERGGVAVSALDAVGVAACGPFSLEDGFIELVAPNICGGLAGSGRGLPNDWRAVPLERPLRERLPGVKVANDAVSALMAERRWGALQGIEHCAYVTWSTGVGVGLCVDGRVLHGKHGNAGHAGHMFVNDDPDASLCGCGNIGDLESQVAGNAIERRFRMDAAALLAAARRGDTGAGDAVDELCRTMGRALYNLAVTLDLQRISLGGAVFWHNRDLLLPRLVAAISGRLPALTDGLELVPAGLGLEVGDYGALALVA